MSINLTSYVSSLQVELEHERAVLDYTNVCLASVVNAGKEAEKVARMDGHAGLVHR